MFIRCGRGILYLCHLLCTQASTLLTCGATLGIHVSVRVHPYFTSSCRNLYLCQQFCISIIYFTLSFPQHLRILIGRRQLSPRTGPHWPLLVPAQEVTSSTQGETSLSHHRTTWSRCWRSWGWSSSTHYFRLEVVGTGNEMRIMIMLHKQQYIDTVDLEIFIVKIM